jgi:hypothetical protein
MTISPTHEQIAQRAHTLWEQRGSPEGRNAEFWAQAERELSLGDNHRALTANAYAGKSGSGSDGPDER